MRGKEVGYNERLFGSGGLRGWYHNTRYHWIREQLGALPPGISLFELGCFDAKLTDYVPNGFGSYVGVDANWENGLDLGLKRFAGRSDVTLVEMHDPADMAQFPDKSFDASVSMETLEHLEDDALRGYLEQVARITSGKFYVTVPNEMGPVFMAKHLGKLITRTPSHHHTLAEFFAAATFRADRVERDQHKGFDYRKLARDMGAFFTIESVRPVPSMTIVTPLALSIGIIARPIR